MYLIKKNYVISVLIVICFFSSIIAQKQIKDYSVSQIVVARQIELSNIKANKIKELQISKVFVFRRLFEFKHEISADELWKTSQPKSLYQIMYYDSSGKNIEKETWNKEGELAKREYFEYNKNGQVTNYFEGFSKQKTLVITYGKYGRVTSKEKYNAQNNIIWKREFVLDDYGDPITMNEYDYKGRLSNSRVFRYHKEGSNYFIEPNPEYKPLGFNQIGDTICVGYPYTFIKIKYEDSTKIISRSKGNYYEIYDSDFDLIKSKWDYTEDNYAYDNDEHIYEYDTEGYLTGQTVYRNEYVGSLTNDAGERISDERGYLKTICGLYSYEYEINKDSISSIILGRWKVVSNKVKNIQINNNQSIEFKNEGVCEVSFDDVYGRRTIKYNRWFVNNENLIKIIPANDKDNIIMYFQINNNNLVLKKMVSEGKIESANENQIQLIYKRI